MIIHISGPSGAGKTTLGKKLKAYYKNKIIVKDLDDLRVEFIKNITEIKNGLYLTNQHIKNLYILLYRVVRNRLFL